MFKVSSEAWSTDACDFYFKVQAIIVHSIWRSCKIKDDLYYISSASMPTQILRKIKITEYSLGYRN